VRTAIRLSGLRQKCAAGFPHGAVFCDDVERAEIGACEKRAERIGAAGPIRFEKDSRQWMQLLLGKIIAS
jgi:hypothetical protein